MASPLVEAGLPVLEGPQVIRGAPGQEAVHLEEMTAQSQLDGVVDGRVDVELVIDAAVAPDQALHRRAEVGGPPEGEGTQDDRVRGRRCQRRLDRDPADAPVLVSVDPAEHGRAAHGVGVAAHAPDDDVNFRIPYQLLEGLRVAQDAVVAGAEGDGPRHRLLPVFERVQANQGGAGLPFGDGGNGFDHCVGVDLFQLGGNLRVTGHVRAQDESVPRCRRQVVCGLGDHGLAGHRDQRLGQAIAFVLEALPQSGHGHDQAACGFERLTGAGQQLPEGAGPVTVFGDVLRRSPLHKVLEVIHGDRLPRGQQRLVS